MGTLRVVAPQARDLVGVLRHYQSYSNFWCKTPSLAGLMRPS